MNDVVFEVPIPDDLGSIIAVNTGTKWIHRIIPGTVEVRNGYITFLCYWNGGQRRRFTVATDIVGGYECNA